MLASPIEQERATAALKATAILTRHNLTWEKALRTGTDRLSRALQNDNGNSVDEIFASFFTSQRPAEAQSPRTNPPPIWKEPKTPPPPVQQQILTGQQIPKLIEGIIKIIDQRLTSVKTEMLVVNVENKHFVHGPLVVFNPQLIRLIKQSPKQERQYGVMHSNNPKHLPILTQA